MDTHSKRHKPLRNLILIGLLAALLVVVFWETTGIDGPREVGAQATAATDILGQTQARAVTAYALYEIAVRDDPSGSRALLLAREAVQYYLDHDLPLGPGKDLMDAAESLVQRQPPILAPEERARFQGGSKPLNDKMSKENLPE